MGDQSRRTHVSLVMIPESMISPLSGIYEIMNSFDALGAIDDVIPQSPPFHVEIVTPERTSAATATEFPLPSPRGVAEIRRTDIVIVPSMIVRESIWIPGRYPEVVDWLKTMHAQGATLCSACSGVLLLAETGLLNEREATIHWAFASTFQHNFPEVSLRLREALVVTGQRRELVMSGASTSWHDLVLYLIACHVGPAVAQAMAKFMLIQWHSDGQAPFVTFAPPTDHGDATVLQLQEWLRVHCSVVSPVEQMVRLSGLPERTFKRRFTRATGYSPIEYVQQQRVEDAKRRLERTGDSVDDISWAVGYEDPASFRRLFKRITRLTPAAYRRKFRVPVQLMDQPAMQATSP